MIIDRGLDQKGTDANIGTSRVNLTQRYVESVKYNGLGDFTEELREEADYRKRIEKIFSEIHMTGETYAVLQPEALMEAQGDFEVEYVSPLNRAQRAEEGVAILRTLEAVAPLAQIDPGVMDIFDPDAIARELAEINGVPAKILRSKEDVMALKEQQAQAAEAQQLLAAAPIAAGAAKTLAETQAIAGNVPGPLPA